MARTCTSSPQVWTSPRGGIFGSPTAVGAKRGRWMLDTIWLEARRLLRNELLEKDYDTWIVPLQASEWSAGVLTLEAPSGFFRDWLRRHFLPALEQAVSQASGGPATITLLVNRVLDVPAATSPPSGGEPAGGEPAGGGKPEEAAPTRYTFDSFVV